MKKKLGCAIVAILVVGMFCGYMLLKAPTQAEVTITANDHYISIEVN